MGYDTAWCVVNSGSAAVYIAQATTNIIGSTQRSSPETIASGGEAMKMNCASDIAGVIAAIGDVASYLSGAASFCAKTLNSKALFAADIGTIVNGLGGIASAASALKLDCVHEPPPPA